MWSGDDIHFMKLALEEAEQADRLDEVPIGAVVVCGGRVIGGWQPGQPYAGLTQWRHGRRARLRDNVRHVIAPRRQAAQHENGRQS